MTEGDEHREAIVAAYRRLEELGFVIGSAGNLSVRTRRGMLITPTGTAAGRLCPDELVEMTLEGEIQGPTLPSSEWGLHAGVYRGVAEAGAVVHTHSDACVALSCLRRPLPAFHYMVAAFGGDDVPCVDYQPFGSEELAAASAQALSNRSACLLANHGMVVRARTLDQAISAAIRLETLARQYLLASSAGAPVILTDEEMAEVHRRYAGYGRQPKTG